MLKILVIGSINMDYVCTVDELPKKGETLLSNGFVDSGGGKGANQAVAARRLGAEVAMIGAVGKDVSGDKLIDSLRKEGINVDYIKRVDIPTGNAIVTVDKNGDNTIVVYSGANFQVDEELINSYEAVIEDNDFIILQLEIPMNTVLYSAKLAKKHGKKVVLNPAPAKELPKEIYEYIDYITPNETELARITGIDDIKLASKELVNRGAKNVVVTLGEKGSYYLGDGELEVESFKIEAVDTTAAGDSFNGALAVALGEGKSIEEALKYANAVGALTTTKIGAQVSLPYKEEVKEFLK
ncbi:ribokinase [Proteiniborus sp. MB09-C3]|uniref:ribokinase n=1 Tax=Proteiniborus sp. MB09-C3 TaxID=3050072 RepID=UPI002553E9EE|nr:ribokinase [Proteiniborus sp. MB09-C3]WIV13516.1 ribokinase [Proteiniborus sp. MB09-C3]